MQMMDGALDRQFESAVDEIEMMLKTEARRKRIIDLRAGWQFATQKLAVEVERWRRDRAAAQARGRINPLRLLGPPDEGWSVALDVGKQPRDGGAMRSGEAPEHGGGRTHFAILDPRQGSAAHPAQRGKFIERPAPRAPQFPQAVSKAYVRGIAGESLRFHIWDTTLENENVKARAADRRGGRAPVCPRRPCPPHESLACIAIAVVFENHSPAVIAGLAPAIHAAGRDDLVARSCLLSDVYPDWTHVLVDGRANPRIKSGDGQDAFMSGPPFHSSNWATNRCRHKSPIPGQPGREPPRRPLKINGLKR